ncbi:MAG: molybdopterin-dependent oxidoreductase, partial [Cyclobacteriaceae bacterium]|nr:molybdopterin-dependent oxidoreductase [Cyclobacteriaceae bacterium]
MKTIDKIRRRTFLKLTGVTGAFLVVGCVPSSSKDTAVANLLTEEGDIKGLNQFVIIDTSGKIVLFNHRPEMGQGTYQAVPMILAEELEVDLNEVEIRHSPADKELYGNQMVVGSQSIRREYEVLRKVAAGTREILILAAAKIWEEKPEDCYAANGKVINRLGDKSLHYGDLVTTAMGIKVPESPKMKAPGDFKVIGQPLARRDIPDKVSGKTIFGLDVNVPGMLYASVERAKVFLGKLVSYDDRATLKVPGVKQVLKTKRVVWGHEREGVAVLADSYWAAEQGRKALKVEWDNGDAERHSTEKIFEKYRQDARLPGNTLHEDGDVDKALANATGVLEASYETPYQSHSPMEPMNAIVSVTEDKVEFWGSTQNPNGVRSYLANQMGMDEAQVTVNYTFMGGAFGRRSMTDVAEEAADLSRQAKVPVKVVWTRQDDLTQGPFRACSLNAFKGSLDKEGRILALEHKVICQEISNQTGDRMEAGGQLRGGINMDYAIPNFRINGVLQKHD